MFELTKAQQEIRKAAEAFAKGEFDRALCLDLDRAQQFPRKIWQKACELGFIGMHFPEAFSGQSLGVPDHLLVVETLCRKDSTLGAALALSGFGSECLLSLASPSLQEKFLPRVSEGRELSGAAFAAADWISTVPIAAKQGDSWHINGEVPRVINAGLAGFYCLPCCTDTDRQVRLFFVEADREGVTANAPEEKLGLRMTPAATLKFTGVCVPETYLLGKPDAQKRPLGAFIDESRLLFAAMALGTAQGALDRGLDYAKNREQFGQKIARFQVTEHKIADMATRIESARFLTYQAAAAFERGRSDSKLISMAKIVAARAAVAVSSEAVQLLGGYGYAAEYEVERCYRDAKTLEIFPESPMALKNDIAQGLIGMIRNSTRGA